VTAPVLRIALLVGLAVVGNGVDGSGKRRNTGSQKRSADARRCPKCERSAALVRLQPPSWSLGWQSGDVTTVCRWCDYTRTKP
jgi:hypothetical protein